MTKHTPGPWEVGHSSGAMVLAKSRTVLIADCRSPNKNYSAKSPEANARLIAAAPELLEHVKLLERSIVYQIRVAQSDGDDEGANLQRLTLHLVRETLAKATGERSPDTTQPSNAEGIVP